MINKFSNIINENNQSKFKISIDFHGVLDSLPDTFSFISESIIKNNGEIHILTGSSISSEFKKTLDSYGVKYTNLFSIYDHLIESGSKTVGEVQFPDGTIQKKFEDGVWDKVKAEYCREHNINLHIDDTLIYNDHFTTPFCRFWSHNNNPKASHKDLRHLD